MAYKKYNVSKNRDISQARALKQVGAKPVRIKGKQMFRVGGGVFTKNEVLKSRFRYGKAMGFKGTKKSVGL